MCKLSKLLATALVLSLVGCGTSPEQPSNTSSASGSSVDASQAAQDDTEKEAEAENVDSPDESIDDSSGEDGSTSKDEGLTSDGTEAQTDSFSITQQGVEEQVEFIRTCYYTPGPDDVQVVIEGGDEGWEYSRDYRYHDGELIFAFIYRGTEEHRLYFKDWHMIRYIDEDMVVYDYGQLEPFAWWEQRALAEGVAHAPEGSGGAGSERRSAWWGTWEGDDGETLVVTEVTADHVSLTYNGWGASGQEMFHSNYVLDFLDDDHTTIGEDQSVLDANGWRYVFTLEGDHIVMSSRSPDRSFWRQS